MSATLCRLCALAPHTLSKGRLFHFRRKYLKVCNNAAVTINTPRMISTSSNYERLKSRKDTDGTEEMRLSIRAYFELKRKSKENFELAIQYFVEKDKHLRGHVEFINAALKYMEEFGVHKDVEVYKKLLDVMPKGKMIARNMFQVEFMHYPKQQQCAIDLLDQMENFGVIPDTEMQTILTNIFGRHAYPVRKYGRMMYWMPKFKNASPWPLPQEIPDDTFAMAKLAIERICSIDPTSIIEVLQTKDVEDSVDKTWIVSGQSPAQRELLSSHPVDHSIKVEGPFDIFLREKCVAYFILRSSYKFAPPPPEDDPDDVEKIKSWVYSEEEETSTLSRVISVHEQDDGTIMAVCATGTSSRDSLLSWVRLLEGKNPKLAQIPVLFVQASPAGALQPADSGTTIHPV